MSSLSQTSSASSSSSTNAANAANAAAAFAGLGRVNAPIVQQQQQKQQQSQDNSGGRSGQQELNILNGLLSNFGEMIGLPGLELNEQNRCSLLLGDGSEAVQVTMELAPDGTLCLYTIMDKQTEGIPGQVKEFISNQPGSEDGTYLSLSSSGTTVFLCLNSELKMLNGLDFETLVRNFYSSANEWRLKYDKLRRPMNAANAMLNRPAAKDKKLKMERYIDKATGFLAIAYIIYRMGGVLA
jgi:hypothetical protein